jgi:hypothetical protein
VIWVEWAESEWYSGHGGESMVSAIWPILPVIVAAVFLVGEVVSFLARRS